MFCEQFCIKQSSVPDRKTEERYVLAHQIPRRAIEHFQKKELVFSEPEKGKTYNPLKVFPMSLWKGLALPICLSSQMEIGNPSEGVALFGNCFT